MRVLLGFPQQDQQTGVYIKRAFEELGHEIVDIHDPKIQDRELFLSMAKQHRPDLAFMSRSEPYCHVIERLRDVCLTSFWNVDVRADIGPWANLGALMQYTHFWFTIAKSQIPDFKKEYGNKNVYWLSEGCDSIHSIRPGGRTEEFDVFFAGSIDQFHEDCGNRVSVLNAIQNHGFTCQYSHGLKLVNEYHNDYVGRSQVCLGNSAFPQVELSMSARDYRIMGAGGFLLTNNVKGIENWFKIGKECETYSSPEEAVEKVEYYCIHKEERIKIADTGYKAAHEKHRFKNRIEEVIKIAKSF